MSLLRSISQEAQSLLIGSTLIEVFLLVLPTNLPCFTYLPSCPNIRVHQTFSLQLQAHGLTQEVAKNLEVPDWNPICKSQADWLRGCSVSASASPPEAPALGVDGSLLALLLWRHNCLPQAQPQASWRPYPLMVFWVVISYPSWTSFLSHGMSDLCVSVAWWLHFPSPYPILLSSSCIHPT